VPLVDNKPDLGPETPGFWLNTPISAILSKSYALVRAFQNRYWWTHCWTRLSKREPAGVPVSAASKTNDSQRLAG
jgi:hypothetical protein